MDLYSREILFSDFSACYCSQSQAQTDVCVYAQGQSPKPKAQSQEVKFQIFYSKKRNSHPMSLAYGARPIWIRTLLHVRHCCPIRVRRTHPPVGRSIGQESLPLVARRTRIGPENI